MNPLKKLLLLTTAGGSCAFLLLCLLITDSYQVPDVPRLLIGCYAGAFVIGLIDMIQNRFHE